MPNFHFFTLVTKDDQYREMIDSLAAAGFDESNSVFTVLDNRHGNRHDPYSAITDAVRSAQAPYVVFCHQDLIFYTGPDDLLAAIREVDQIDPRWAVLGNSGQATLLDTVAFLDDPGGSWDKGDLPARVVTLDENFLVIRADSGVSCSPEMSGFHLYATDLVLRAYEAGFSAYVMRYRVWHKSSALDYSALHQMAPRFYRVWQEKVRGAVIETPSMFFIFSRTSLPFRWANRIGIRSKLAPQYRLTRTLDYLLRHQRAPWLPMARFQDGDVRGPKLDKSVRVIDSLLRRGRPQWSPTAIVEDVPPLDETTRVETESRKERERASRDAALRRRQIESGARIE